MPGRARHPGAQDAVDEVLRRDPAAHRRVRPVGVETRGHGQQLAQGHRRDRRAHRVTALRQEVGEGLVEALQAPVGEGDADQRRDHALRHRGDRVVARCRRTAQVLRDHGPAADADQHRPHVLELVGVAGGEGVLDSAPDAGAQVGERGIAGGARRRRGGRRRAGVGVGSVGADEQAESPTTTDSAAAHVSRVPVPDAGRRAAMPLPLPLSVVVVSPRSGRAGSGRMRW